MSIRASCPGCKTSLDFPDELTGKRVKCKSCGEVFRVEPESKKSSASAPAVKPSSKKTVIDEEPRSRRRDEDDDEDPPRSRRSDRDEKRRYRDDDEDDRRSRRRDEDEEDDEPRRRGRDDFDEDEDDRDQPAKKSNKLLYILLPAGALVAITVVVILVLALTGKRKKGILNNDPLVTIVPELSVELQETEIQSGHPFTSVNGKYVGLIKRGDLAKGADIDIFDTGSGAKISSLRVDTEWGSTKNLRNISLSDDGKMLLYTQQPFGRSHGSEIVLWSVPDRKLLYRNWDPYPTKDVFSKAGLHFATFVGSDKIVSVSNHRNIDLWQVRNNEITSLLTTSVRASGEPFDYDSFTTEADTTKCSRVGGVAVSPDGKKIAVFNGNGFSVVNLVKDSQDAGIEICRSPMLYEPRNASDRGAKVGQASFSPDSTQLAFSYSYNDRGGNWDAGGPGILDIASSKYVMLDDQASSRIKGFHGLAWWGTKHLIAFSDKQTAVISASTGNPIRQLMAPPRKKYFAGFDGRIWYVAGENDRSKANLLVVKGPEQSLDNDGDPFVEIKELRNKYLKRLWLEPNGVRREPSREDPSLLSDLIMWK